MNWMEYTFIGSTINPKKNGNEWCAYEWFTIQLDSGMSSKKRSLLPQTPYRHLAKTNDVPIAKIDLHKSISILKLNSACIRYLHDQQNIFLTAIDGTIILT